MDEFEKKIVRGILAVIIIGMILLNVSMVMGVIGWKSDTTDTIFEIIAVNILCIYLLYNIKLVASLTEESQ